VIDEEFSDVVVAIKSVQVPGECEGVTPESIIHQLAEYATHIGHLDMIGKSSKPYMRYGSYIHISRQGHSQLF